ncbi:MAG: phosphatidylcholine/phosphatidylserine synthase [Gemmataceae bacterium]
MSKAKGDRPTTLRHVLAWGVHFYTALGLVAAAAIAVLIVHGGDVAFRGCFLLMLAACVVDATDGTLARKVGVKKVLPGFDGSKLDDITDFLNYTFLPLLLIWRAELIPESLSWCLLIPLVASGYGFCQVSAKTDDGYFLGFPSYWNLVAFYLYLLRPETWLSVTLLIGLAFLTFVPSRYLYPSQKGRLNMFTNVLGAFWTGLLIVILLQLPPDPIPEARLTEEEIRKLAHLSLAFPIYYMAASWVISWRYWRRRRKSGLLLES